MDNEEEVSGVIVVQINDRFISTSVPAIMFR